MDNQDACKLCEKILITFKTKKAVSGLLQLPNTFDLTTKKYTWLSHHFMSYALVPQSLEGKTAHVDMLICVDEDDLDDIDLLEYVNQFFKTKVLPQYPIILEMHLADPILSPPDNIECSRRHHYEVAANQDRSGEKENQLYDRARPEKN